ncbi:MAG: NfeD family protein [Flavobacteriales bacterium]|nr:NfeD family protein [Flavobacteriales bacterium]
MIGAVIALLLLGILLILLEIVFVPGTTIVGIGGGILLVIGIYMAYGIGGNIGHISLFSSLMIVLLALGVMLKAKTWQRLALKDTVSGRSPANVVEGQLKEGERGVTIGRLNPMGKATFGDAIVEVHTTGEIIGQETEIEVVKVIGNRVQVRSIG